MLFPKENTLYTLKIEVLTKCIENIEDYKLLITVNNNRVWYAQSFMLEDTNILSLDDYEENILDLISYLKNEPIYCKYDIEGIKKGYTTVIRNEYLPNSEFLYKDLTHKELFLFETFEEKDLKDVLLMVKTTFVITDFESAKYVTQEIEYTNLTNLTIKHDESKNIKYFELDFRHDILCLGLLVCHLVGKDCMNLHNEIKDSKEEAEFLYESFKLPKRKGMSENLMNFVELCQGFDNGSIPSARQLAEHPFMRDEKKYQGYQ
ncbi:hypothetical protein COBT_002083 [Conglomerata obtusa]